MFVSFGRVEPAGALEVAVHRHVAEVAVPAAQAERVADQRPLPGGVDHEVGVDGRPVRR